jgi:hypothetical protein
MIHIRQLGKLIIVSILILLGACHIFRKKQCTALIPTYVLSPSFITYTFEDGNKKTVTEYDTLRPLGKIYGCGRQYFYHTKYFDANTHLLSSGKMTITGSNDWFSNDYPQTKIRYDFPYRIQDSMLFSKKLSACQLWQSGNNEGVLETDKRIWIHPVRSNQFVETEIMAFPEINLPAEIGKKWSYVLIVEEGGWGKWAGSEVENIYEITSKTSKIIKDKNFDCWVVQAKTKHYNNGVIDSSYTRLLFNERLGFVEISHKLHNQDSIAFDMYNFKNKKTL